MSIFTNPVTLTSDAAHTFVFRAQLPDPKSIVGEWVEPAAPIGDESKILVKHTGSTTVKRHLFQRTIKVATPTRGMRPITVNFTVAHDIEHPSAAISREVALVVDGLGEASFIGNLLNGLI